MNKFGLIVIELLNGATRIERDEDYRTGTFSFQPLGTARIKWDSDYSVEYVDADELRKVAKGRKSDEYLLVRKPVRTDVSDMLAPVEDETDKSDEQHASVEALETALSGDLDKALEMDKPVESKPKRAPRAKRTETDKAV